MSEKQNTLRWVIHAKVDLDTHELLLECANRFAGGNVSELIRRFVTEGLDRLWHEGASETEDNVRVQALLAERRWQQRQATREWLQRVRLELMQDPDPELEEKISRLADHENLLWPPENFEADEADPAARRVMTRLRVLWGANAQQASLRDLQRGLWKVTSNELRLLLLRLSDSGKIRIEGDLSQLNQSVIIFPPAI